LKLRLEGSEIKGKKHHWRTP